MKFRFLKGGVLSDGVLGPRGYVLGEFIESAGEALSFSLKDTGKFDFTFVFGFRGIGSHFRLDFSPAAHRFVLSQIRDGISIYLQHAILDTSIPEVLNVQADKISIRIFYGKQCFINIIHEGSIDGRWGFSGVGYKVPAPVIEVKKIKRKNFDWLILGDGYSNNRWKNRDFYSWPELAFGNKLSYLNACVAAGNTRRIQEIIEIIGPGFAGCKVIVAAGADDVMEGEELQEVFGRLRGIVSRVRNYGAAEVHITTLVPKPGYQDMVVALNHEIHTNIRMRCDSILDFNRIFSSNTKELLMYGDFPGTQAQQLMANYVIDRFHIAGGLSPLADLTPRKCLHGISARAAARLSSWLNNALGHF